MKSAFFLVLGFVTLMAASAFADPSGVYSVVGTNPGSGGGYKGSVTVERTGDTYSVVWVVGGTKFVGTGIGAADVEGTMMFGDAAIEDTAITISYKSANSFGLALFFEQPNGQWEGIWTYAGSKQIGTEVWTPSK